MIVCQSAPRLDYLALVDEHDALHSRLALGALRYDEEQRKIFPPVDWPILGHHPSSGAARRYIGAHARSIHAMVVSEARILLMSLPEQATQPEYVHRHQWRVGDLLLWYNRTTLHRRRSFDLAEKRELKRVSILDDVEGPAPH